MIYLLVLLLVCIILLVLYCVQLYNGLIALKVNINNAWSNTEVILKQRNNELAKLIELCQPHISSETAVLDQIRRARIHIIEACNQTNIKLLNQAEQTLKQAVKQLKAFFKHHPKLQTLDSYQHLLQRLSILNIHITDRKELYNESVDLHNSRIEQFPEKLLAQLYHFSKADLFDLPSYE